MSDVTVWIEDEWDDRYEAFQPRAIRQDLDTFVRFMSDIPSPDEGPGLTLDELLGDIDTLIDPTEEPT